MISIKDIDLNIVDNSPIIILDSGRKLKCTFNDGIGQSTKQTVIRKLQSMVGRSYENINTLKWYLTVKSKLLKKVESHILYDELQDKLCEELENYDDYDDFKDECRIQFTIKVDNIDDAEYEINRFYGDYVVYKYDDLLQVELILGSYLDKISMITAINEMSGLCDQLKDVGISCKVKKVEIQDSTTNYMYKDILPEIKKIIFKKKGK